MADASRTLEIIVRLRDLASRNVRAFSRSLQRLRGVATRVRSALFNLRTAVAGLGIALVAKSFLDAAITVEQYRSRLNILAKDQEEANEIFRQSSEYAGTIAAEYEDILGAAVTMKGVVKGGADEVMRWVKIIADIAAVTKIGVREVTQQVLRMYSSGAASADLFQQRGVLGMLGFKAKTTYLAEETRKILTKMWDDPANKFVDAAKRMSNTWTGMMSMMKDAWFQFRVFVMDSGVFGYLKAVLQTLLGTFRDINKSGDIDKVGKTLSTKILFVLRNIVRFVLYIGESIRGWQMIFLAVEIAWKKFGLAVNWVVEKIVGGTKLVARGYEWLLEIQSKILDQLVEMARKMEAMARKSPIFAKELGKVPELLKELATDAALGVGEALESVREFRREQEAMTLGTEDFKKETNEALKKLKEQLEVLVKEGDALENVEKIMAKIDALAKEYADSMRKAAQSQPPPGGAVSGSPAIPPPAPRAAPASTSTVFRTDLARLKADQATTLTRLDDAYRQGTVRLEEYFRKRRELVKEQYELEVKAQEALLDVERAKPVEKRDSDKILELETRLYTLRKREEQELTELQIERVKEVEAVKQRETQAGQLLTQMKIRAKTTGITTLGEEHEAERTALAMQQEQEMLQLEELLQNHVDRKAMIEEAYRVQQLQRDKLLHDQRKRALEFYMETSKGIFADLQHNFMDLYKQSGKSIKEWFYVAKAAAIAGAIITTFESANNAFWAMSKIPIVGPKLAPIAAAAAVAAGMARVDAIRRTTLEGSFAEGGLIGENNTTTNTTTNNRQEEIVERITIRENNFRKLMSGRVTTRNFPRTTNFYKNGGVVKGSSPTSKSDDKIIRVTSGEYVQPVASVKYYGRRMMDAIRTRAIPRDALSKIVTRIHIPAVPSVEHRFAYATGGPVTRGSGQDLSAQSNLSIGPFNITAEQPLADRLNEAIEQTVIDVMRQEVM